MANRFFTQFSSYLDKGIVNLYFRVTFGSSGAPTLQAWDPMKRTYSTAGTAGYKGIKSIVRVSAGLYTINLQDAYNRFLGAGVSFENSSAAAAPLQYWPTPNTNIASQSAPSLQVQFANSSGTATDPASGEAVVININLQNSSAL